MGLAWTMDHLKLRGTSLDPWWIIGKRFLPILIGLDKFRPSLALMWIWRQKRMNATCDILTTKMHKWPFLGVKLFWLSNHSVQCQIHQKNLGIGQTPPFFGNAKILRAYWQRYPPSGHFRTSWGHWLLRRFYYKWLISFISDKRKWKCKSIFVKYFGFLQLTAISESVRACQFDAPMRISEIKHENVRCCLLPWRPWSIGLPASGDF